MGYAYNSKTNAKIDKDKLLLILARKEMKIVDLYRELNEKYQLNIQYKTFLNVLDNIPTWRLSYAMCICEHLEVPIEELFYLETEQVNA